MAAGATGVLAGSAWVLIRVYSSPEESHSPGQSYMSPASRSTVTNVATGTTLPLSAFAADGQTVGQLPPGVLEFTVLSADGVTDPAGNDGFYAVLHMNAKTRTTPVVYPEGIECTGLTQHSQVDPAV
jgi:hypothetical protein